MRGEATHSTASIGTSSGTVYAGSPQISFLMIQNDHATNSVYLNLGPEAATLNSGIKLAPGAIFTSEGDEGYGGPVRAIATGATTGLLVTVI